MNENFLTPAEVADILKLKKNTVYEMIKRGDLPASKLGKQLRIRKEDFDNYLNTKSSIFPSTSGSSGNSGISGCSSPANTPILSNTNTFSGLSATESFAESTIIICGQDTILDKLCDRFNGLGLGTTCLRSRKGSYNALYSLYHGQANIATCHLCDCETDQYNLSYIPKLLPGISVRVFHILNRVQGFYVAKGNPKNIQGFQDLTRKDLTFVNREPGCGTRVLLDGKLLKAGINPDDIRGYYSEKTSHLECATAVAVHAADFALGNERASKQFPDIDFIPLQTESYDLVIPSKYLSTLPYQKILEILRSEDFQLEVKAMGGYHVEDMGKELSL